MHAQRRRGAVSPDPIVNARPASVHDVLTADAVLQATFDSQSKTIAPASVRDVLTAEPLLQLEKQRGQMWNLYSEESCDVVACACTAVHGHCVPAWCACRNKPTTLSSS
jgi:hypothetical protein